MSVDYWIECLMLWLFMVEYCLPMPGIFEAKLLKTFLAFLLSIILLEVSHLLSKVVIPQVHSPLHTCLLYSIFLHSTDHRLTWFICCFCLPCPPPPPPLEYMGFVYCLVSSTEDTAWHRVGAQYKYISVYLMKRINASYSGAFNLAI